MFFNKLSRKVCLTLFCLGVTSGALSAQTRQGEVPSGQFRQVKSNRQINSERTRQSDVGKSSQFNSEPSVNPRRFQDSSPLRPRNDKYVDVQGGSVFPVAEVNVPALTSGRLSEIDVVDMQEVQAEQLMAVVDREMSEVQVASSKVKLEAAMARATDDVAIRYAQKAFGVAKKEAEISRRLARKGAGPVQEYERSKLAADQAELQIEKSKHDLMVAGKDAKVEEFNVSAAETNLTRHDISSPLSGNIVEIYKHKGEWVNEGEEVFRIIQLDRVRVEGLVEIGNYSPSEIFGRPVTVTLNSAGRQEVFEGKVVMVDMETKNGRRFTVRAEVENRRAGPNRWVLISGAFVDMRIHLQDPLASNPADNSSNNR